MSYIVKTETEAVGLWVMIAEVSGDKGIQMNSQSAHIPKHLEGTHLQTSPLGDRGYSGVVRKRNKTKIG